MSERHRIEIEIGADAFAQLAGEAARLGIEVADVVSRAAAAWLCDMGESEAASRP